MENAWPLWALPFWTMGVPLIWAVIEKVRTPTMAKSTARQTEMSSNFRPASMQAG